MNPSHKNLIKERYENAVHEYCLAFCLKHGYQYNPDGWVGNDIGTIVLIEDYYINFSDIRYDIDNDVPEDVFEQFYDYTIKIAMLDEGVGDMKRVNYPHYCFGFRPYSREQLDMMKKEREEKECLATQTDQMNFIAKDEICGNCKNGCLQSDGNYVMCMRRNTYHKYNDTACTTYEKGGI